MHLGRFNYVLWDLKNYYEKNPIVQSLDAVINALNAYQSTPTPDASNAFRAAMAQFEQKASETPDEWGDTSYQQVLENISGQDFVGPRLVERVRTFVREKALTPADLLKDLQVLKKELSNFVNQVIAVAKGLDDLGAEYQSMDDASYEIGMHLPQSSVGESISDLLSEIEHVDRLFKTINEIMGRGSESVQISTFSTTWYQIFLNLDATQISAVVFAIERIVALYKSNLEIRRLKKDADDQKLGDIAEQIDKKITEKIKEGIEKIASETREKFQSNNDQGRLNELEIQLKIELTHVAKRINQGAEYEVRVQLPNKPKDLTEEEAKDEEKVALHAQETKLYEEKLAVASEIDSSGKRLSVQWMTREDDAALLTDYEKLANPKADATPPGAAK